MENMKRKKSLILICRYERNLEALSETVRNIHHLKNHLQEKALPEIQIPI